ncbi:ATP-binding protein [Anaeromyxobacter oryzae]|uniref:4Fe-4S ferredoxin n=1 Tax=Anaeromyxobacter oryzae TaxID=2918170 RepID=A0ABN6MW23_9BACT|nr:4Fe-4S binding protein [Anaeromyxobacter oryzae]BDG03918.1 4Fe-4S ferredoxin [Anaeromyxobacter oryzae]
MIRKIVQIDESKCDGCGQCIPSCAEGAIALVNGKARLSSDVLCDGLGACLGECPQGAIAVIERDAPAFDEAAVAAHLAKDRPGAAPHAPVAAPAAPARPRLSVLGGGGAPAGGGCPGSRSQVLPRRGLSVVGGPGPGPGLPPAGAESRLGQWPVQLHLVPVTAPYFEGADLLVAADCVPFAYARFHEDFLAGRAIVIGCPKLDDNAFYAQKLGAILSRSDVRSVTVVRMEVPCCGGISMAARQGIAASGKAIPLDDVVIGVDGARRG